MTPATFLSKQQLAPTLFRVDFLPEKPIDFIPGQFIELVLPRPDSHDERGNRRWFSVASAPHEKPLSIITRFHPSDSSSFKNSLFSLDSGSELLIADAMGDFVLPKDSSLPTIWVAAGVGISPFISKARFMKHNNTKRSAHLFWTTSQDEPLPYGADFAAVLDSVFVSDKKSSLTPEDIMSQVGADLLDRSLYYVAGPEKFVEGFIDKLATLGIPRHRLIGDFFHGYEA
jgi:glycine betaine catabolism B